MAHKRTHTRRKPRSMPHGVLVARTGGFGFVQTAEGEYFIPASALGGAFDGDLVEIAPLPVKKGAKGRGGSRFSDEGDKPAARVLRVLDRAHDTVIGRYEIADPFGVVVPHDTRIPYDVFTMRADYPDIEEGSLVRVRITQFPARNTAATGVIEEVIGRAGEKSAGVDVIVARHKLETSFSPAVLEEARSATLDEFGALAAGYRDLRERFVFTVDPADAKDFDDALSIERTEGGWRLGVHIADVAHYVGWNSSVDLDARRRATSVYLVDRVIPMLPHELSDDLCSLKPDEDRRCVTVDVFLDDEGCVQSFDIYRALIRSKARLTYDEALALLQGAGDGADALDLASRLRACSHLAKLRVAAREQAGGIDFDTVEAKVRLDDEGSPVRIELRAKNDATQLVEEAMILANETVARYLEQRKWPCAYRVHQKPASDALAGLVPVFWEYPWFSEELAARLSVGDPYVIQEIIACSRGRAEGELVSSLLLRSMRRALYRPANDGHYGLASEAYCHFTSPIRRYPDLEVHRMLAYALTKRPQKFDQEVAALPWICEHSSDMERVADAAARESQELKMVEYLSSYVDTSFSAVVSGVASYGIYVRLECTAEGFVPVRSLGREYFAFDADRYTLTGEDSGRVYRLGQRVAVVLKVADTQSATLEFAPLG